MTHSALTVEPFPDGVALVTLRRPERLNALTWELVDELAAAFGRIAEDRATRVVVLTGEGRGFCSGLDINGSDAVGTADDVLEVYERQEKVASLALILRNLPQPVIAAVNGAAAGGGLALALGSDIRICVPTAKFNVAFVRLGLSGCDVGVSHLLPRIVGLGAASELMLTGRPIDAEEALRIGLVNRVVPAEELQQRAFELAAEIARNSPFGVRMTKQVLAQNVDATSLEAAIELENRTQVLATRTADMAEALDAFRDKRDPSYTGR